jgi:hypothetical protein
LQTVGLHFGIIYNARQSLVYHENRQDFISLAVGEYHRPHGGVP